MADVASTSRLPEYMRWKPPVPTNPLAPFRYKQGHLRLQESYYKKELAEFYTKIHGKKPRTRLTKAELAEDIAGEVRKHLFKVSDGGWLNDAWPRFDYDKAEGVYKEIIFSLYDETGYCGCHASW